MFKMDIIMVNLLTLCEYIQFSNKNDARLSGMSEGPGTERY